MNKQPEVLFRKPVVLSLPEGDWQPLPVITDHGADSFLVADENRRLLLSSKGNASYSVSGSAQYFVEDGLMQRFEIGLSQEGSYICSALSPHGTTKLLIEEDTIISVSPLRGGGLSVVWLEGSSLPRNAWYSVIHTEDVAGATKGTHLGYQQKHDLCHVPSSGPTIGWGAEHLLFWFEANSKGCVPRFLVSVPGSAGSSRTDSLYLRSRYLSYEPLSLTPRVIGAWGQRNVRAVIQTEQREILYMQESLERGGEATKKTFVGGADNVQAAEWLSDILIAWQKEGLHYLLVTKDLLKKDSWHDSLVSVTSDEEANYLDYQIVFDSQDQPHIVSVKETEDGTTIESFAVASGKSSILYEDDRKGYRLTPSRDKDGRVRGLLALGKRQAVLLLPINRSLPVDSEAKLQKDMQEEAIKEQHLALGDWSREQFEREKRGATARPGAWSGH